MAVRQLKDGRWICYYRKRDPETGKSKDRREYFGRGADAQMAAEKRNRELGLQKRRPSRSRSGPAFIELAKSYLVNKHLADNTREVLIYKLSANILPFFGHRNALGLKDRDLDLYVAKRRRDGVSDSTIRRELTDIKAILSWSVARRPPIIPLNPVRDYKKPRAYDAVIPPPSTGEVKRILKHAADHLTRAILLSYYLGLRPGAIELLSLAWLAVSWETQTIMVSSAHKGGPEKRMVPVHDDLLPLLRAWYAQDGKASGPIIHYHGQQIRSIKTAWRRALRRAGITRRLRPYDLRHAFATAALEQEADIKALSEIMGSRPETLMRTYQHVSSQLRRDTVSKIPGLTAPAGPQIRTKNHEKGRPKKSP